MTDAVPGRKDQHLDVVLSGGGRHGTDAGFDAVRFVHEALPDLDHGKIDLGADFLGRRLQAPLLISAMTGGPARAGAINIRPVYLASAPGWLWLLSAPTMGLGPRARRGAALAIGLAVVLLPQLLINLRHFQQPTPLVLAVNGSRRADRCSPHACALST